MSTARCRLIAPGVRPGRLARMLVVVGSVSAAGIIARVRPINAAGGGPVCHSSPTPGTG